MIFQFFKKFKLVALGIFLGGSSLLAELPLDATREFRNQHGQRFNASVVSVEGNMVSLRRSGDTVVQTPINSLRESDQEFVKNWEIAYLLENYFDVSLSPGERRNSMREDRFRDGETVLWGSQILFQNRSQVRVRDIPLRYRIYYRVDHGGGRYVLTYDEFTNQVEEVSPGSRFLYRSHTVLLRELEPSEGTNLVGHEGGSIRDEIVGIKVFFEPGAFRPAPLSYPENLQELID